MKGPNIIKSDITMTRAIIPVGAYMFRAAHGGEKPPHLGQQEHEQGKRF